MMDNTDAAKRAALMAREESGQRYPLAPPIDYAERLFKLEQLRHKRNRLVSKVDTLGTLHAQRATMHELNFPVPPSEASRDYILEQQEAREDLAEINAQISKLLEGE